jgi:uncharacterized membrane protein YphA (DoxX/SURF4 family)
VSCTSSGIGWLAAAAIIWLRVVVGLHFVHEGWTKLQRPQPFSAAFFSSAKGPLAKWYHALVWDPDGLFRLDLDATLAQWDDYRQRIVNHYGLDEAQQKKAEEIVKRFQARLRQFLGSRREQIDEYLRWLDRRDANAQDPARQLASLRAHDARIAGDLRKLASELLPPIDQMWQDLENELNALATDAQYQRHGRLAIVKPGRRWLDSEAMDRIVPYFDLAVGGLLVVGLLARWAALAGAVFLGAVCLSQWPLAPGAAPIAYQAVEMAALLVLAAVGAGRYLGLDVVVGGLKRLCCPGCCGGGATQA